MKKKLITGIMLFFGISLGYAQVGINTTTPNAATVLDVRSPQNNKGILIPKITEAQRDSNIADNDSLTTGGIYQAQAALEMGTLIFNSTKKRFEFWDGKVWRQLFVATSSTAGNDGVVKVNSGAGGVKPTYNLAASGNTYGPPQLIEFVTPLVFASAPTTSWPETTVPFPGVTSNIYIGSGATQRWRENPVQGQVHVWRLITTVTPGSNSSGSVKAIFRNPDSGFVVSSVQLLPSGSSSTGNNLTFYFYSVADPASLDVGKGYQVSVQSDITCQLVVESLTRISMFKD